MASQNVPGITKTSPSVSKAKLKEPEDSNQAIVQTPFGRGLIIRKRSSDGIREIQLLGSENASNNGGKNGRQPFMLYTPVDYPSVPPHVGDDVVCQYGRGRITKILAMRAQISPRSKSSGDCATPDSEVLSKEGKPILSYSIELQSWRLNGRSRVTCYLTSPPSVVRKHTVEEMDTFERVEFAQGQKSQATKYFSDCKNYELALLTYAGAVDAVKNVNYDSSSTNEVRADLIVVMVTCSNNAATCCIKLERWEEASRFAKNALILLDALYSKRGKKIHTVLNREGTIDARLFGEWRVKSCILVARSALEKGEEEDAVAMLKKARVCAMEYIDQIDIKSCNKEEKMSVKTLTSQIKEVKRLMAQCAQKKKANKLREKKRAQAMFGGDKEERKKDHVKMNGSEATKVPQEVHTLESDTSISQIDGITTNEEKGKIRHQSALINSDKDDKKSPKKSVSFSRSPPQVKEFDSDNIDESVPWYSEHKEALIMLAVGGLSAAVAVGFHRIFRRNV